MFACLLVCLARLAGWLTGWHYLLAVHTSYRLVSCAIYLYAQHFSQNDFFLLCSSLRAHCVLCLCHSRSVLSVFSCFSCSSLSCSIYFFFSLFCMFGVPMNVYQVCMLSDRMKRAESPRIVLYVLCVLLFDCYYNR